MVSEGLAIDDSRPSPEIPRQRPQIEPLIPFPGITRDNAHAVVATFSVRPSCAGCRTSRLQRSTLTVRGMRRSNRRAMACIGNPNVLRKTGRMGVGAGTTRLLYACQQRIKRLFQNGTGHRFSKIPTLYRYWQAGYTIVLVAYRRLQESTRESVQFREF